MAAGKPHIVVIGAGASGLGAARYLTNTKKYKVTVLEARDRTGGRVWTHHLGDDKIGMLQIIKQLVSQPGSTSLLSTATFF